MLSHKCVLSLLTALALCASAIAQDADVREGLELYRSLQYDRAVVVLARALGKSRLSEADRAEALETLGFAYTVLGDGGNGELTFHALLDLEPQHTLDAGLSPRLRDAFSAAKKSWSAGRKLHFQLTSSLAKKELTGELQGGDPERAGAVTAREESGKTSPLYCQARACRGERPDEMFFVDVADHQGAILDSSGPHEPELSSDGPPWWLYAVIAVGVLGGGVAISVAFSGRDDAPVGSLGKLQLP